MNILSAAEMQACDRITSERFGVTSIQLMRNASRAVANFAQQQFPRARRVLILCGRGNNGGDGAMTACLLAETGLDVTVLLLGSAAELKGDAAVAWHELEQAACCTLHIVESAEQLERLSGLLSADLMIDAIVGTGFKPPLRGLALHALHWITTSAAPILSIDLPSGWPSDATSSHVDHTVFPSDAVVTFTAPKPAHVFGELTRHWAQPVVVAPIGSPEEAIRSDLNLTWAGSAQTLYHAPRKPDSNKGNFGHVLVVGGSFGPAGGKSGAPTMSSLAALRAGAGLVTAAVPAPALPVVASFAPELMTVPLDAGADGEILPANASAGCLERLLKGISVLVVGPGMGQSDHARKFLHRLLIGSKIQAVIDADALNILAQSPELLRSITRERTIVLTPHPGEMSRLAGIPTKEVQEDRLRIAREFAQQHNVHLVLKGSRTLIAHPGGSVAVNTSGNPGMAKGGSGDLLTGIIAGMLAQFPQNMEQAIEAAVYLHGLSADIAVGRFEERTLLATDTLPYLSRAFRFDSATYNNYGWLQGLARRRGPGHGNRRGN